MAALHGASARESRVSRLLFFVGGLSLGPRKNDLTNYWALGLFVRPFTSLVDPGDIYPPQAVSRVPLRKDWFVG